MIATVELSDIEQIEDELADFDQQCTDARAQIADLEERASLERNPAKSEKLQAKADSLRRWEENVAPVQRAALEERLNRARRRVLNSQIAAAKPDHFALMDAHDAAKQALIDHDNQRKVLVAAIASADVAVKRSPLWGLLHQTGFGGNYAAEYVKSEYLKSKSNKPANRAKRS